MSAAPVSSESIRSVLPFPREAAAHRAAVGCRAGALGLPPRHPASAPAQLLLLEEDPDGMADQLRRAFPTPEYELQVADPSPGGLRHVGADSPDVVVLGLGSRTPSGLDLYQQIRQINARVPVIFLSRARRADAAIEAMKQGAYDILLQPIELPVLRRVVGTRPSSRNRGGAAVSP
jgi:DNA-binding NtrC family response regulator